MISRVYSNLRSGLQALLPSSCLSCERPGIGTIDLCPGCYRDLPRNRTACAVCALPGPAAQRECGHCQAERPPYSHLVAPWLYDEPLDGLVQALKFQGRLPAGRLLGTLLARELVRRNAWAHIVVPLPLHPRRLRQRGFNQAAEIARCLPPQLGIPVRHDVLRRTRGTPPQSALGRRERTDNIRGAFAARPGVRGLRVAVVDDVVTTGSTTEEAARALLRQGARDVVIWAVARATLATHEPFSP